MAKAKAKKQTVVIGNNVKLHYKGTLTDGTQFDNSYDRGDPMEVTAGTGKLIAGFDNALIGMKEGQKKSITIGYNDAYGPRNEEAFTTVPRTTFPQGFDFEIDAPVQGTGPQGNPLFARISDFNDEEVTLDLNHPLAGQDLNFDIEVLEVSQDTTE